MSATAGELIGPDSPRWRGALDNCWHQVYQLPEYVRFDAELTGASPVAFLYTEGDYVLLLPFAVRPIPGTSLFDAISPYGYPGPVANRYDQAFWGRASAALLESLREAGLVSLFVRLDPLQTIPSQPLSQIGLLHTHGSTVSIDLRLTREQWWTQVRKDHRGAINRSRRLGRTSVMDDWGYLDDFIAMYRETMDRVGATSGYYFGRDYFERLRESLGDQTVHLLMLLADGEPMGGSVLLTGGGGIMQAHLAGIRSQFQRTEGSPRFLVNEEVRWGHEHGYDAFHLGGGVGGREDSLFEFKRGFSPRRHAFQTLRVIGQPDAYRELARASHPLDDPTDMTGFFPLYRA